MKRMWISFLFIGLVAMTSSSQDSKRVKRGGSGYSGIEARTFNSNGNERNRYDQQGEQKGFDGGSGTEFGGGQVQDDYGTQDGQQRGQDDYQRGSNDFAKGGGKKSGFGNGQGQNGYGTQNGLGGGEITYDGQQGERDKYNGHGGSSNFGDKQNGGFSNEYDETGRKEDFGNGRTGYQQKGGNIGLGRIQHQNGHNQQNYNEISGNGQGENNFGGGGQGDYSNQKDNFGTGPSLGQRERISEIGQQNGRGGEHGQDFQGGYGEGDHGGSNQQDHKNNLDWFKDSVRGVPGQDYPAETIIPKTSFSCKDQNVPGIYGDVESRCQVFHVCQKDGRKDSFLCPIGTIFNQKYFVCDWWYNVNCEDTPNYYGMNQALYTHSPGQFGSGGFSDRTAGADQYGSQGNDEAGENGNASGFVDQDRKSESYGSQGESGGQNGGDGNYGKIGNSEDQYGLRNGKDGGYASPNNFRRQTRRENGFIVKSGESNGYGRQNGGEYDTNYGINTADVS